MLTTQPRVLIAEPDDLTRDSLSNLFTDVGAEPLPAPDAAAALRIARSQPFHASVIDVALPDLPGLRLLQLLRQLADRPCMFVGRTESKEIRLQVADLGAWSFIPLPFAPEIVRVTIQVFVRRFFSPLGGSDGCQEDCV
jgi:DNA-binding response OmpR family regulator